MKAEFDAHSSTYADDLQDPIRDRFQGKNGDFFHERKRQLIQRYFEARQVDTKRMAYLDLGCGRCELAALLRGDFGRTCGCDPSQGMINAGRVATPGIEVRLQVEPDQIPYDAGSFDFVSAVCVYHHVSLTARAKLTAEVARVLKPGGTFAIIEHNPYNPVTRGIVGRTPIDADAILLAPGETTHLMESQGFAVSELQYFLYLPQWLYRSFGALERLLTKLPLGGQYAAFGTLEVR